MFGMLGRIAGIGAHVARERIVRPTPRTVSDIPYRIEAITPEWLTQILCSTGTGASVTEVTFGEGSSGTSVRRRLQLAYNDAGTALGLPTHLFVKSTPDLLTRLSNGLTCTMIGEAGFYTHLRPLVDLEAPVGYHSAYDLRSFRSIHVMEDLIATKSVQFCSATSRIDRDKAEQVMRLLARLHGRFAEPAAQSRQWSWLRTYEQFQTSVTQSFNVERSTLCALGEGAVDVPAGLRQKLDQVWSCCQSAVAAHRSLPGTVLHNDVHLGNFYITQSGQMGLCDWQCTVFGHWSRDLAYALSTMLTTDERREWESDLIALYLDERAREDGLRTGWDEIWRLYRQQLFGALIMWTPCVARPRFAPDMQPMDLSIELVRRIATAIDDLDAIECFDS